MDHEINHPKPEFHIHNVSFPIINDKIRSLMKAHKVPSLELFKRFCLDEGAPHSVTWLRQWLAYLSNFTLLDEVLKLHPVQSHLIFGVKDHNSIKYRALGMVNICFPLPYFTYFSYESFLIYNDIPMLLALMLLALNLQRKLQALPDKNEHSPTILLRKFGIELLLVYKDGYIYYEGHSKASFLFTTIELAQIHRNLGHAPAGAVSSALKQAYPIEAEASDLTKLQEVT